MSKYPLSMFKHFAFSTVLTALLFSSAVDAGQLYRYKDAEGKTVLNRTIPPEMVKHGYDILNEKGRVIDTVAPALTPEQIAARDAELERQKKQAEAEALQQKIDSELTQLYSHPNDAVRVLERSVQDIRGIIQLKLSKIDTTKKQIAKNETKAANIQRNGVAIPKTLISQIANLKKDVENAEKDINELNGKMDAILGEFDKKIKRLEFITEKEATDYQKLLDSLSGKSDQTAKVEPPANP